MIGRKIIQLECVDSTNNYVAKLIQENNIEVGTVILADEQLNGRGQRGSVWSSNSGENLLMSFYLDSVILSVSNQFVLSKVVAVSIVNTLLCFGIEAKIKWPNDIYVKGRKISGVLIENQISGKHLKNSIVGIGFNINQIEFNDLNATSLMNEIKTFTPIKEFTLSFIHQFNLIWEKVENKKYNVIDELYISNLYLLNQESIFIDEEGVFVGVISGVKENGHLILVSKEREKTTYDLKEVTFVHPQNEV